MTTKLYLAYGANTNFPSMAERCPKARYVCNITLPEHALVFRGVADVVWSKNHSVDCAMWLITPECEASLDRFEGFPAFYTKKYATVRLEGRRHRVMFYVMTRASSRGQQMPSRGYEACLREGYAACGIDADQIDEALQRVTLWRERNPSKVIRAYRGSWTETPTPEDEVLETIESFEALSKEDAEERAFVAALRSASNGRTH